MAFDVARAFDGLYDAATLPEAWPDALQKFAAATNSAGCSFRPILPEAGRLARQPSRELGGFLEDFASGGWHLADPRLINGLPLVEAGRQVVLEHDITSEEERRRSPFYQTLLRKHDLPWWSCVAFAVDGRLWCLSILRTSAQGPFTRIDGSDLAGIALQLRSVVALAGRLSLACARGSVDALERIGRAAMALDERGQCIVMNTIAEDALTVDLMLVRNRLRAADPKSDSRLQDLLGRATSPKHFGGTIQEPVFVARRQRPPYMVEAFPATAPMRDIFRRICALVVVSDLDARPRAPETLLFRSAFGLTVAEARLASKLAAGEELRAASDTLGMSYNTARVHLRAIFGKVRVNRQSELAAVLTRMAR